MKPRSVFLVFILLAVVGCDGRHLYTESEYALGPVEVTLKVVAASRAEADRAMDAAFAAISQVNNLMSLHLRRSEVSQLNRSAGSECHISRQTSSVLSQALEVSEMTSGAFDVTAGPLIRLWKEGIETRRLPGGEQIAAAKKLVGYRRLTLGPNSAKLAAPGMSVDLGGIAKGYAVDKAVGALRASGIKSALVDAGGDGYALGKQPDGRPWRIAVQDPNRRPGGQLPELLLLSDTAYATSGDYQQYVEIDGLRYAHIIDPRTGQPARVAASVTVIAPNCTTADALATAISVLGPDEGIKLVNTLNEVECMIISRDGDQLNVVTSPGFPLFASYNR